MMFENTFGLQITEDELGYIVLYIQSALERRNQRYSAILLAESNLGHAQLLSERIRKTVPEISSSERLSAFMISSCNEAFRIEDINS